MVIRTQNSKSRQKRRKKKNQPRQRRKKKAKRTRNKWAASGFVFLIISYALQTSLLDYKDCLYKYSGGSWGDHAWARWIRGGGNSLNNQFSDWQILYSTSNHFRQFVVALLNSWSFVWHSARLLQRLLNPVVVGLFQQLIHLSFILLALALLPLVVYRSELRIPLILFFCCYC